MALCLTVVEKTASGAGMRLSGGGRAQTLAITTIGDLKVVPWNLERSLRLGDELGGHIVQGRGWAGRGAFGG